MAKDDKPLFESLSGGRIEFFQKWFSDTIPHNKALGTIVTDVRQGAARMRLDWREDLVGNPETGVLHGGAITALLDSCSGMSVATRLTRPQPFATLDLRIDYVRPATPRQPVFAEAECFRITRNVAFTRAVAHQGDPKDPIAASAGTFMMATKGNAAAPGGGKAARGGGS
ncbi:MAG: PaaI family thioesterase [Rhodospirillales bacterium]|nr:MAG: PaaI family thioesterase [Rhodospirillales bacterium]